MSLAPTRDREIAHSLSGSEPDKALSVARKIEDAWFRCQALSQVARYWPDPDYQRLLKEAVQAGDSQNDAFKQMTVSAWPIRAYLERGSAAPAKSLLERCTSAATRIENMGSRSEALFMGLSGGKAFRPRPLETGVLGFGGSYRTGACMASAKEHSRCHCNGRPGRPIIGEKRTGSIVR